MTSNGSRAGRPALESQEKKTPPLREGFLNLTNYENRQTTCHQTEASNAPTGAQQPLPVGWLANSHGKSEDELQANCRCSSESRQPCGHGTRSRSAGTDDELQPCSDRSEWRHGSNPPDLKSGIRSRTHVPDSVGIGSTMFLL